MLDFDLAELYQVETKALNRAVKRNIERFPERFMFQLTSDEFNNLRFQIGTSNGRGGRRYMPFAFTEQGVAMLSAVLHSTTAIEVSISIMDAFVALRNYLSSTTAINAELTAIKAKLQLLEHNDEENMAVVNDLSEDLRKDIDNIYEAIGALSVKPAPAPRNPIGYKI